MTTIAFDNQVAVVTGAGSGLGRTYALELARRGAKVVVNDLGSAVDGTGSSTAAEQTVAEITLAGGEAIASLDSVATPEGGEAIVHTALEQYGRLDILINNAGILRDSSFLKLSTADLEAVLDVHLRGAFFVTQPAFRQMKMQRYGRILFTSSTAGLLGNFGQANYAAAKMGLVGLSNVLAAEGASYGITSNALAPGARTRMTDEMLGDLGALFDPDLVTPLALYMVSNECELTHEILSAGGGRYARYFVGMTPGWFAGVGAKPTVEELRDHIAEVRDEMGYVIPTDVSVELTALQDARARTSDGPSRGESTP